MVSLNESAVCVLLSCYFLYYVVHIDCLPARRASPPIAIECVDYHFILCFEFSCQVRRYQPPLENFVFGIDERIHVFFINLTCTDKFLDHFVLSIKHMQIRLRFALNSVSIILVFILSKGRGLLSVTLFVGSI